MAKEVTAGQASFEFLVQMVNLDKSGPMAAVTALWFLSTSKELGDVQSEAITLFSENSLLSFFGKILSCPHTSHELTASNVPDP